VVGDESSQLQQQKGYDGQDTIAYRSTKVRLWVRGSVGGGAR
jgi:hypothetical protein